MLILGMTFIVRLKQHILIKKNYNRGLLLQLV